MMLDDQVKLNDPGASQYIVNTLAQDGWNGLLRFNEGEIWRLRNRAGDDAARRRAMPRRCLSRCPGRRLALARHHAVKAGRRAEARAALRAIWRWRPMRPTRLRPPDVSLRRCAMTTCIRRLLASRRRRCSPPARRSAAAGSGSATMRWSGRARRGRQRQRCAVDPAARMESAARPAVRRHPRGRGLDAQRPVLDGISFVTGLKSGDTSSARRKRDDRQVPNFAPT